MTKGLEVVARPGVAGVGAERLCGVLAGCSQLLDFCVALNGSLTGALSEDRLQHWVKLRGLFARRVRLGSNTACMRALSFGPALDATAATLALGGICSLKAHDSGSGSLNVERPGSSGQLVGPA